MRSSIASSSPGASTFAFDVLEEPLRDQLADAATPRARAGAHPSTGVVCSRKRSIASSSSATPLAGRRFGLDDRRPPLLRAERLQRQQRLDRRDGASAPSRSALFIDEDVGDLHDAGLERLDLVARAWHDRHERHVGRSHDVDFVLADANGLDQDDVLAGGVEHERDFAGRAREPPRWPRVAMLRMNTPSSPACACMRTRSPRIAPPVNGLVGSTATTPTSAAVGAKRPRSADRRACSCPRRADPVTPMR